METRRKFVERFGEDCASKIEDAAKQHREKDANGVFGIFTSTLFGSQPNEAEDGFLLDIATCIAFECLTRFKDCHKIASGEEELRNWIKENAVPPTEYRDPATTHIYCDYLGEIKS